MDEIYEKVALNLGIPKDVVQNTYKAFWRFIRSHIEEMPLKDIESQEEFNRYRPNFSLPYLGKFGCTYMNFKNIKNSFNRNVKHKEN